MLLRSASTATFVLRFAPRHAQRRVQPLFRVIPPRASSTATQNILSTVSRHYSSDMASSTAPLFSTSRLQGKVVVITGASGGIGRSTAILFARAGANVVLSARRQDALDAVVKECEDAYKAQGQSVAGTQGGKFAARVTDMRDRKSIDALYADLPDWAQGKTDILVSNAGLVRGREHVGDIDPDEIDEVYETNVRGFIHVAQLFVREFKKRNSGHIITLGSIAGREAYPGGSIYASSKFAVAAFTSALLKELVNTNIRVTEIQPGMVETSFSVTRFRGDKSKADKEYEGLQPLTPDDIAEDIVFAASRPAHVQVAQTLVFPVHQASPYHNYRGGGK